jgi:hypothetical protein
MIVTGLCRLTAECHSTCIVHPYYFTPFKDQICFLFILKFSFMSDSSLHSSSPPSPTPLCFGYHCLWYNITSTNTFMDSSQFKQFYLCRNPPTCRKSLTNYITKCCIEYISPLYRFGSYIRLSYTNICLGPSLSWSYGSWICNYLCNQCLSPLTLWVQIPHMERCIRYNILWYSLSVTCDRSVDFYTNKTV